MQAGVLFISPSVEDARALAEILGRVGIPATHAQDLNQARNLLEARTFGAVLTEKNLPDGTWEDVIRLVGRIKRRAAVVVTDLLADARFWADVLEYGAYDLLPKPFCAGEVQRILANAVDQPPLLRQVIPAA
ncbi:MAG: hypothetical protein IT159_04605 [Bryobacterales bacterium]|nr:hypothetical protein [Bryobacterales bacterium]